MRTSTNTLIKSMMVLAEQIESSDGVANAAIAEAAGRLRELDSALREVCSSISNCQVINCDEHSVEAAKSVVSRLHDMRRIALMLCQMEAGILPGIYFNVEYGDSEDQSGAPVLTMQEPDISAVIQYIDDDGNFADHTLDVDKHCLPILDDKAREIADRKQAESNGKENADTPHA